MRPAFALNYAGLGRSGRSRDDHRYATDACVQDTLAVAADLHTDRAVVIGTSFGGLLAMGLSAVRRGLPKGWC
ncbi:MAG: alpha/beta fold hydrolase [Acetobacteraceae bacterium]